MGDFDVIRDMGVTHDAGVGVACKEMGGIENTVGMASKEVGETRVLCDSVSVEMALVGFLLVIGSAWIK